jgi:hypothetical protein
MAETILGSGPQDGKATTISDEGSIPFARSILPPPQLVLFANLHQVEGVDRRNSLSLRLFQGPLQFLGAGAARAHKHHPADGEGEGDDQSPARAVKEIINDRECDDAGNAEADRPAPDARRLT